MRNLLFDQQPIRRLTWSGDTWSLNSDGRLINTPTLGADLLTDGGLENWSSATNLTSWVESLAGSSSVNQETSVVQAGSNAARLTVDGSASFVSIGQIVAAATVGMWLQLSAYLRSSVAAGKLARIEFSNSSQSPGAHQTLTDTYVQKFQTGRVTASNPNVLVARATGNASHNIYSDALLFQQLALSSLFRTVPGWANNIHVAGQIHAMGAGSQVGVVANLDSAATPANFLIAYFDGSSGGTTNIKFEKCVAGIYTNLFASTQAFRANETLEIRRPSGNVFQVWWGGNQIDADQTVSDAGIIDNTLYGLFSTRPDSTVSRCWLGRQLIPFDV